MVIGIDIDETITNTHEAAEKYIKLSKDMEIGKLTIGGPSHITSFYLFS